MGGCGATGDGSPGRTRRRLPPHSLPSTQGRALDPTSRHKSPQDATRRHKSPGCGRVCTCHCGRTTPVCFRASDSSHVSTHTHAHEERRSHEDRSIDRSEDCDRSIVTHLVVGDEQVVHAPVAELTHERARPRRVGRQVRRVLQHRALSAPPDTPSTGGVSHSPEHAVAPGGTAHLLLRPSVVPVLPRDVL